MCLFAFLTTRGSASYKMNDSVLGYLFPVSKQGITALLDHLRCNLMGSYGPNKMSQRTFIRFRSRSLKGSQWYWLLNPPKLPTYSCHMRPGIIRHQHHVSKDLILLPNSVVNNSSNSEAAIVYSVQVCASLYEYTSQTNIGQQLQLPSSLWQLLHELISNLLSSVKRTGHLSRTCQLCCSLENATRAPKSQTISTGPNRGSWALRLPSWSLF